MAQGTFKAWDAHWLRSGALALALVDRVGGRVMGIRWHDRDLSFVHPSLAGKVEDVAAVRDLHAFKREQGFPLWGGDKTWLSPQDRWTDGVPFVDLDSGLYQLEVLEPGRAVRLTSPVCRETGIQVERTVRLGDAVGSWSVNHRLANRSKTPVVWGIWSVGMMLRPATVYLPTRADSEFVDGVKAFGNEGRSESLRSRVLGRMGRYVSVSCTESEHFKYGADAHSGSLLAVFTSEPVVALAKRWKAHPTQEYGHGCIAEVFNSPDFPYFELEAHGPVVELSPGSDVELTEHNRLLDLKCPPATEAEVDDALVRVPCP